MFPKSYVKQRRNYEINIANFFASNLNFLLLLDNIPSLNRLNRPGYRKRRFTRTLAMEWGHLGGPAPTIIYGECVCVLSTYLTKQGCVNPPSLRHFESNNEKSCRCYICSENDKWWKAFATQCLQMSRNVPFQFSCQNSGGMDIADFQNCSTTSEVTGGHQRPKHWSIHQRMHFWGCSWIPKLISNLESTAYSTSEATWGQKLLLEADAIRGRKHFFVFAELQSCSATSNSGNQTTSYPTSEATGGQNLKITIEDI